MKSLERVLLLSLLAAALLIPACEAKSVAPWPYTTQPETGSEDAAAPDGGASDDGATEDGAADDASDQGGTGAGGIQANYAFSPLRCDGGLCDTDNYSLCNIAGDPVASRAVWPLSTMFVVAAMAVARARRRRRVRLSS
jgi:hypothetical protein